MFDRCDSDARAIVDAALAESRRRGHSWLGTEHVLLAMVQRRDLLPGEVAALLPDVDAVAAALAAGFERPPRPDSELLKVVGVDLDEVRRPYVGPSVIPRSRTSVAEESTSPGSPGDAQLEAAPRFSPGPCGLLLA